MSDDYWYPSASKMGRKSKLTMEERVDAIERYRAGEKAHKISVDLDIHPTTIHYWNKRLIRKKK